ncbi:hypothetical protein [Saccharothrix sp.]|uniref:hypothetical protein n=1 Tax=Saccharothrix sp. TaxID=1873460 RepID=UPI0028124043|nr:hypothetical protein [Saccharothrix sp.]
MRQWNRGPEAAPRLTALAALGRLHGADRAEPTTPSRPHWGWAWPAAPSRLRRASVGWAGVGWADVGWADVGWADCAGPGSRPGRLAWGQPRRRPCRAGCAGPGPAALGRLRWAGIGWAAAGRGRGAQG